MKRWPVVLLLSAVLFACSRTGSMPDSPPVESQTVVPATGIVYRLGDTDVTLTVPASTEVSTVSGEQPEEVLPYVNTMTACPADVLRALATEIPREQLAAFSERGDVYLFFDFRR